MIKNKITQQSEGYGFLEFNSHEAAAQALATLNGQLIPNTDQIFRLNWAAFGVGKISSEGARSGLWRLTFHHLLVWNLYCRLSRKGPN